MCLVAPLREKGGLRQGGLRAGGVGVGGSGTPQHIYYVCLCNLQLIIDAKMLILYIVYVLLLVSLKQKELHAFNLHNGRHTPHGLSTSPGMTHCATKEVKLFHLFICFCKRILFFILFFLFEMKLWGHFILFMVKSHSTKDLKI